MKPLLWIDVETTGLDEKDGLLLEVGAILTDRNLEEVGSVTQVIGYGRISKRELVSYMDSYVQKMHTKNGLIEAVRAGPRRLREAEFYLLETILGWQECWRAMPIAGSSPHFDRRWLKEHMPTLSRLITHQQLDVSSFRIAWSLKKPEGHESTHRALDDLRRDIAQLKKIINLVPEIKL